jgi:hypothetical protein
VIHPRAAVMRYLPMARLFFSCIRPKSSVLTAGEGRATSLMKQIIFLVLEPVALGLRRQRYGRFDQGRRHVCPPAPVSSPNSDPAFEQQECINKAKALFGVTEEAKRFASAAGRGQ